MPIQHAVLTLLVDGPSYGYELKARFHETMGPTWGSLNIGHVYQVLDRLERDGLASATRMPQASRPDRVVYALTPAGRSELLRWLEEPSPAATGYRDDLFLTVMAITSLRDHELFTRTIARLRTDLLQELRDLDALRRSGHTPATRPLGDLLVTAAELQVRARLDFLERAGSYKHALLATESGALDADPGREALANDDLGGTIGDREVVNVGGDAEAGGQHFAPDERAM